MIKLYSTHCPKCNVLKKKLEEKNIRYEEIDDVDLLISKGITTVPILQVDNFAMGFAEAIKWVNDR